MIWRGLIITISLELKSGWHNQPLWNKSECMKLMKNLGLQVSAMKQNNR